MVLNLVHLDAWKEQHLDLFRRWTELRESIETLETSLHSEKSKEILYNQYQNKQHQISSSEPVANKKLLQECYEAEEKSRKE